MKTLRAAAFKVSRRLALKKAALRSWWLGVRVRWFWASPWGGRLQKQREEIAALSGQIGELIQAKEAAEKARDWEQKQRKMTEDRLHVERERAEDAKDLMPLLAAILSVTGGSFEVDVRLLQDVERNTRVEIQRYRRRGTIRLVLAPHGRTVSSRDDEERFLDRWSRGEVMPTMQYVRSTVPTGTAGRPEDQRNAGRFTPSRVDPEAMRGLERQIHDRVKAAVEAAAKDALIGSVEAAKRGEAIRKAGQKP